MLHIVNKSPYENNNLASCLRLAQSGHAVLLIEDGVYAAVAGGAKEPALTEAASRIKLYALKPDVEARGMGERLMPGVTLVDYAGFVGLVAEYPTSHSWL